MSGQWGAVGGSGGQWGAVGGRLRCVFMFHSQSACFYCPREGCEGGGEGSRYIRLHVAGATESATIRYIGEKEEEERGRRRGEIGLLIVSLQE